MTARAHLLRALATLHEELVAVRREAEEQGDHWTGLTADRMEQAAGDVAAWAERERLKLERQKKGEP